MSEDRTRVALERMAREEPRLAARLVLMTMPAAVQRLDGVSYDLVVRDLGAWRVRDGRMEPLNGQTGEVDFRMATDAEGLAAMVSGASPLKLMLTGRVRIRGSRRQAAKLRELESADATLADAVRAGAELDVDAVFRSLPYLIDASWTRGHTFVVGYHVGDGHWYVHVNDGVVSVSDSARADADVHVPLDVYRRMVAGELSPNAAMRDQLSRVDGNLPAVTLLGRWIDRAQGRDDAEQEREDRQRLIQANRLGVWGSHAEAAIGEGELMGYGELYALWERQNWRVHELDFSEDKEQWVTTPAESQENLIWSTAQFAMGEERVTADLAPFLAAAPSGEVEVFLATQLVDEARHTAFFDRFGAEVLALSADDMRGRMSELNHLMPDAWREVFDDGLRDIARRIQARPDDLALFVEGITTYHLVIEGVLAMTGQRFIIDYHEQHGMYPGFRHGFGLVERDEHRHIAFGVRFLKDVLAQEPRLGAVVERRIADLVPRAMLAFVPPSAAAADRWVYYGNDSAAVYGFAYRKLKRRMQVLGLEIPSAEELMPGPIATPEEARARNLPV